MLRFPPLVSNLLGMVLETNGWPPYTKVTAMKTMKTAMKTKPKTPMKTKPKTTMKAK